jgi:hypothetical protein
MILRIFFTFYLLVGNAPILPEVKTDAFCQRLTAIAVLGFALPGKFFGDLPAIGF